jgi:asparagine synthase (glutamine-hydrolysing)
MCGIAGIWNTDGRRVEESDIDRFTDALLHRGPDDRGVWREDDGSVALGHRRLAILDPRSDGRQPMSWGDGRYVITYNGEVYNFLELREVLEGKGHLFRTGTDTEVILASYVEWGEEMLLRFNGMWAFAIYDREKRILFLARDRFGVKPLHYRQTPRQFAFASELKAFRHLDGFRPELDRESARLFLEDGFGVEGTARTLLQGVHRLRSGHLALLRNGRLEIRRWWNTLDHLVSPPDSLEAQAGDFRELFDDAVRLRMRSDVPIGSCLSGGFDSASVVCTVAGIGGRQAGPRQAPDWQRTFVAAFPGASNDERAEAEEIIRFAGVKGNFLQVADDAALPNLDEVLDGVDGVWVNSPTALWLIYREFRRAGVVVSLDGHGADELMGGYVQPDYLLFHDTPPPWTAPRENLKRLGEYRDVLRRFSLGRLGVWRVALSAFLRYHPSLAGAPDTGTVARSFARIVPGRPEAEPDELRPVGRNDALPPAWGDMNRRLYRMFHSDLLPTILRVIDRLSMAHGVEVRMPFMDWRLVRFVFSLPDDSKVGAGMTKRVARVAMEGRIPETIRTARHKVGFTSPMPEWFSGPMRGWLRDQAFRPGVSGHDLVDGARLQAAVRDHDSGRPWTWRECSAVWSAVHLLWFERQLVPSTAAPVASGGQAANLASSRASVAPVSEANSRM